MIDARGRVPHVPIVTIKLGVIPRVCRKYVLGMVHFLRAHIKQEAEPHLADVLRVVGRMRKGVAAVVVSKHGSHDAGDSCKAIGFMLWHRTTDGANVVDTIMPTTATTTAWLRNELAGHGVEYRAR